MELFQFLLGSVFSLLGATSVLYIAFRAHVISNEVSEMKELLRDIRRATQDQAVVEGTLPAPPEAGNWPSVMDPDYESRSALDIKPAESRR